MFYLKPEARPMSERMQMIIVIALMLCVAVAVGAAKHGLHLF
jgi:hypothetical protein